MEGTAERSSRARLVLALVLVLGLGVAVLLVALGGSGQEETAIAADPECVERWNSDENALRIGRHQYGAHGYSTLEVTRLSEDGTGDASEREEGVCTLVFPAQALDPEPPAAALAYLQGSWVPLSALPTVSEIRLAELQSAAYTETNATMASDGSIDAS